MLTTEQLYNPENVNWKLNLSKSHKKTKTKFDCFFFFIPLQHLKVCHPRLLSSLLMAHLHRPALAYLSIFICPSFTLLSLRPCLLPSSLSLIFSPHMWFCSPSLCTPSLLLLLLLLFSHPSLTYGFSPLVCVCVFGVTQSSLGLPAHVCICVCVCVLQTETGCVCVCVLGRVQQGSGRLCNTFICRSCRGGRLHLLSPSDSSSPSPPLQCVHVTRIRTCPAQKKYQK